MWVENNGGDRNTTKKKNIYLKDKYDENLQVRKSSGHNINKNLLDYISKKSKIYKYQKKLFFYIYKQKDITLQFYLKKISLIILNQCFENIEWDKKRTRKIAIGYLLYCIQFFSYKELASFMNACNVTLLDIIITLLTREKIDKILTYFENYQIINFLQIVNNNNILKIIHSTDKIERKEIYEILKYNPNFAGSLMSNDFLSFYEDDDIFKIKKKLKEDIKYHSSDKYYYVTDKNNYLLGKLDISDIFYNDDNEVAIDVAKKNIISVKEWEDREDVAQIFKKFNLLEVPVVNEENKMIGIIYYDEIYDTYLLESEEDFYKISGIEPLKNSYLKSSNLSIVRSRITWLLVLMISATLSQVVIQSLQTLISRDFAKLFSAGASNIVALFAIDALIPLISGSSGNAGTQASTTIIKELALGRVTHKDYIKIVKKELVVSILVGILLSLINAVRMIIYDFVYNKAKYNYNGLHYYDLKILIAISASIIIAIIVSKITGVLLPLIVHFFKKDPSLISSPLLTTIVDAFCNGISYSLCICVFVLWQVS